MQENQNSIPELHDPPNPKPFPTKHHQVWTLCEVAMVVPRTSGLKQHIFNLAG